MGIPIPTAALMKLIKTAKFSRSNWRWAFWANFKFPSFNYRKSLQLITDGRTDTWHNLIDISVYRLQAGKRIQMTIIYFQWRQFFSSLFFLILHFSDFVLISIQPSVEIVKYGVFILGRIYCRDCCSFNAASSRSRESEPSGRWKLQLMSSRNYWLCWRQHDSSANEAFSPTYTICDTTRLVADFCGLLRTCRRQLKDREPIVL